MWFSSNPADGMLGQLQYWSLDGSMSGGWIRVEWEFRDYTLTGGSNIGRPYAVGNNWTYEEFMIGNIGGAGPGQGTCGVSFTWNWYAEVVAANVTVTVPAGTFTDVFQIDYYVDWNADAIFDKSGNPLTDELTNRDYWSPTAMANVKQVDFLTYDGPPGGDPGLGNIGPSPEMIETMELKSYNLVLPPPPGPAVGGTIVPIDKLGLAMPWIIAISLMVVAAVSLAILARKRRMQRHSGG